MPWFGLTFYIYWWNNAYDGSLDRQTTRTQAENDFIIFLTTTITALISGAIQQSAGRTAVNVGDIMPMLFVLPAVIWFKFLCKQNQAIKIQKIDYF